PRVSSVFLIMLFMIVVVDAAFILLTGGGLRQSRKSEAAARHIALHDSLNGLPNRVAFIDALDDAITARRSDGTPVAVAYFDLDGFKEVNDGYGHEIGDHLLKLVAAGFRSLSHDQVLARIGGDEFALIITGEDA